MIQLETNSKYTHPTNSDGTFNGRYMVKILKPRYERGITLSIVPVEYYILEEVEVEDINNLGKMITVEKPFLLEKKDIPYTSEEVNNMVKLLDIHYDINQGFPEEAHDYVLQELSVAVIKTGGVKQKGTFSVPPNDWKLIK